MIKRYEKNIIQLFLVFGIIISFYFIDLYPFSLNPLFTKRTDQYSFIVLRDKEGKILSNAHFEVYMDYASQFEKAGLKNPPTINKMGRPLNKTILEKHLLKKLISFPFLKKIQVKLANVVAKNSGLTLNVVTFDLENPHYRADSPRHNTVYQEDKFRRRIKSEVLLEL